MKGITQDDRLDDLKKVVNANSSDVGYTTNDQGEKVFRIYGKVPVGIEANGELNIVSDGNIYVAGRSSGTSGDKELKLGSIQSSNGDIRILGKAGVSNSLTDGSSNLTGNDLILEGGTADIGTADKAVTVDLSGMLNARTDGSLYIDSVGTRDLQMEALYAGKEASLSSAQGIIMSPTAAEQAYLNAGTVLNLSAQNGIGTEGKAIRILDNGAIVNARSVTGDIYLAGKGSGDDSLFLVGTVSTDKEGTVSITAESDLAAGREDGEQPLVSTIDGGTVSLFSSRNLALDNGSLTADTLKLTAGGSVTQTEAHAIKAQTASVDAVSGISLNSGAELESDRKFNAFENVTLKNASDATDVVLGNGGDKGLTVTFAAGSKAKNVTVRNYADGTVNDLAINGPIAAAAGIALTNDEGNLTTTGAMEAESSDIREMAEGSLTNKGSLNARQDIIQQAGQSAANEANLTAGRDIISTAGKDLTDGGALSAGRNVSLTAGSGSITNGGAVTADQNVTMTAGDSIENQAAVTAAKAALSLTAQKDIAQQGDATAGTSVLMDSQKQGNIAVTGDVTSGTSTALKTKDGSITAGTAGQKKRIQAGTTAALTSETGDIIVQGTVASQQGAKLSTARKGDILVKGSLLAAESGDAEARTQEGSIQVDGTAEGARDVLLSTARGDAAVTGRVKAGQDVKASADLGNMTFQGTLEAGRDISARTGRGNMDFAGSLTSGRDLTAVTEESGNMVFNGLADAGRNFLADARQEGTITLRKDIRSGMDASFHTNDGSLLFAGVDLSAAEDIHVTADTGSVTLSTTGRGDIKDSHRQANGDRAFVSAPAGNVTIRHTGVGDVDLYSLYAHKDAGVEVADGNLYLDTVNGDLVAVLVKNARKVLDVEHMVAGTGIRMTGADMSVDDVLQRVDSQGNLTLTLDGASEDMPIESLAIGDIKSNTGVRFPRLWLRKGSVQVSEGEFLMDKLMILDKAVFSNGTMVTHVFGTTPVADQAATSVYWNNTRLNRPQEFLGEWRNDNGLSGRWMYLNFDRQGHTQFSNGNLLDLDPHNYVYNQRYSETNWTRTQGDRDFGNFWTGAYHPELSYHDRYGLQQWNLELPGNAKGEELSVEEV